MIDYFKNIKLIFFIIFEWLQGWWYWWYVFKVWSRGARKLIIIVGWKLNLILASLGLIAISSLTRISKSRAKERNIIKLTIIYTIKNYNKVF